MTERRKPRKRKRAVSVDACARSTAKLPAGESKIVRLTLSRTQVARLRKAMKRRRGLTVTLQIVATAAAGEPTAVSRRLVGQRLIRRLAASAVAPDAQAVLSFGAVAGGVRRRAMRRARGGCSSASPARAARGTPRTAAGAARTPRRC